jgi:WD40 repeat protein
MRFGLADSSGEILLDEETQYLASVLKWSPDGDSVAISGGCRIDVVVRNGETGAIDQRVRVVDTTYAITSLTWSSDSSKVAVGCNAKNSNQIVVKELSAPDREMKPLVGHRGTVVALHWPEDGTLISLGEDRTVRYWNPVTGRLNETIATSAKDGVFSPDGKLVASRIGNTIRIWEAATGRTVRSMILVGGDQYLTVTGDGQIDHSPDLRTELVYLVMTEDGQRLLTPAEFAEQYRQHDPDETDPAEPAASQGETSVSSDPGGSQP